MGLESAACFNPVAGMALLFETPKNFRPPQSFARERRQARQPVVYCLVPWDSCAQLVQEPLHGGLLKCLTVELIVAPAC